MDCLKSFSLKVSTNSGVTLSDIKQWTNGLDQKYFTCTTGSSGSKYNIEGFKNINVWGVNVTGSIGTIPSAVTGGVVINNWAIDFKINGQAPFLGGTVQASPNYYVINATSVENTNFPLSRYSPSVKFHSPIQSVKSIEIGQTYADGYGWETSGTINLYWNLNFTVYYNFEGE
jgi:hypothetical protein